ncbi:MAG TPA: hypothetical protein VLK82_14020 [Candidatus Tectomicrobia bacterium]|nr:hypothetical protein [Candidatus Tectomicrobia bacterium]
MRLLGLNEALGPQVRATVGRKPTRDLSGLTLVRQVQALAERWMQALLQSECTRRRFRQRAWATAERVATKASRKRPTTAQSLRERLSQPHETIAWAGAVTA